MNWIDFQTEGLVHSNMMPPFFKPQRFQQLGAGAPYVRNAKGEKECRDCEPVLNYAMENKIQRQYRVGLIAPILHRYIHTFAQMGVDSRNNSGGVFCSCKCLLFILMQWQTCWKCLFVKERLTPIFSLFMTSQSTAASSDMFGCQANSPKCAKFTFKLNDYSLWTENGELGPNGFRESCYLLVGNETMLQVFFFAFPPFNQHDVEPLKSNRRGGGQSLLTLTRIVHLCRLRRPLACRRHIKIILIRVFTEFGAAASHWLKTQGARATARIKAGIPLIMSMLLSHGEQCVIRSLQLGPWYSPACTHARARCIQHPIANGQLPQYSFTKSRQSVPQSCAGKWINKTRKVIKYRIQS